MAIYSAAIRTTNTTAASAAGDILMASGGPSARLLEVGFTENAATAGVFGIGRPGNDGSQAQSSAITVLAEDGNNAAAGKSAIAGSWSTSPTVPTNFFRRISMNASVGAGIIWTFPRGLIYAATKGVVLWVIATAPVLDLYWVTDE